MVKLALYTKPGNWTNALIRWRTSSPYSHCEILIDGVAYSASGRDGGVRSKYIDMADWDVIDLPWVDPAKVLAFFSDTDADSYDYLGVILGRSFDLKLHGEKKWFCSQWCAAAIGMTEPWRFTPADLASACGPWLKPQIESGVLTPLVSEPR